MELCGSGSSRASGADTELVMVVLNSIAGSSPSSDDWSRSASGSLTSSKEGSFDTEIEEDRDPKDEAVTDSSTDTLGDGCGSYLGSIISGTTTAPWAPVSLLVFDPARFLPFFGFALIALAISLTGSFPLFRRSFDLAVFDDDALLASPASP